MERAVSRGIQTFDTDKSLWPLNKPVPKLEALTQVRFDLCVNYENKYTHHYYHRAYHHYHYYDRRHDHNHGHHIIFTISFLFFYNTFVIICY